MDEHSGNGSDPSQSGQPVRPVVYQPTRPDQPRKTPFNPRHMPVGVSANTIDVARRIRIHKLRRMLFFGVPVAVLLLVVAGIWLAARGLSPLSPKTVSNDIYEYHFLYYKDAEPVNLDQGAGLQDGNLSLVIAKPTTDPTYSSCSDVGKEWSRAFVVTLERQERLVCTRSNKEYVIIFTHEEKRHLFEVTFTSTQSGKGKADEIRTIFQSLKVTTP